MDYIFVREAATKLGISKRRAQKLCKENRIKGQLQIGHIRLISKDAPNPTDLRKARRQGGQ